MTKTNETSVNIPLCRPSITEEDIATVADVLRSGWLAHGEFNHRFEQAFARLIGVRHAVAMNSCTSALEIALKLKQIRGEVIVPSMTWVATANCVVTTGGTPVFCEVDRATRNVTAKTIAERITPATQAVIVVHYGGQPCAMDDIVALCERHKLFLIEDSAETLGATWRGKQAGSYSVGCFSFFPTKNITTGEGGMLTCDDAAFADQARALIAHGVSTTTFARERQEQPWLRAASMPGHNFRMPNPLAALGLCQIQRLDALNARRQRLAGRYRDLLLPLRGQIRLPEVHEHATHSWQMYTVEVAEKLRNSVVMGLRQRGIGASVHFDPPVHLQPFYKGSKWREGSLPVTELLARELITLPMYPDMTDAEQDFVAEGLRKVLNEA
jgi:perosamine synthetase